jgi:pimeloyl-ACP methyl ester carboxylesterase
MLRKVIFSSLAFLAVAYLAACATLFFAQRSLLYFPQPRSPMTKAATMALPVAGADLVVTVREREGADALLYFGGNAEDVSYSLALLAAAYPQRAIYLMHYRGYGGSTGSPSEAALVADATALFDAVHASHHDIMAIGRSLGSGVAIQLASTRPVTRLVLVTPYASIEELASQQFPYFPVRWLLRDRYESWRYAPQIDVPTLLIVAERDEIIPRASSEALLSHFAADVATLRVIAGVRHNTVSDSPHFLQLLRESQSDR